MQVVSFRDLPMGVADGKERSHDLTLGGVYPSFEGMFNFDSDETCPMPFETRNCGVTTFRRLGGRVSLARRARRDCR